MRVETAIARCRRDLTFGTFLKGVLAATAAACMVLGVGFGKGGAAALVGIGGVWAIWMTLNYRSVRASRIAAGSPLLIAAGDYDRAEAQIEEALWSFSLFRTVKLMSLHHLAVLRHAQRRWAEAALVASAVLHERRGTIRSLSTRSRLILADALLEMGDVHGAYAAIAALHQEKLSLQEALNLTLLQLDYQARIGRWEEMLQGMARKIQLVELMPAGNAARAQAFLALAAMKAGREELGAWLRKRVELLADTEDLVRERPILQEIWGVKKGAGENESGARIDERA